MLAALNDIILSVYPCALMTRVAAPSDTPSSVYRFESQGSRPFGEKKLAAAPICHQLSSQISLFFTESQQDGWSHFITAVWGHSGSGALHASLTASPPPLFLPYSYHQGNVE